MSKKKLIITNPTQLARNIITAESKEELEDAMEHLHLNCVSSSVETLREFAKQLKVSTMKILMLHVSKIVRSGDCPKEILATLEDEEIFITPAVPSPIISWEAQQLVVEIRELSTVEEYYLQRKEILRNLWKLSEKEYETVAGILSDCLDNLLINRVLKYLEHKDMLLDYQLRILDVLQTAEEAKQLELIAYFMRLDERGEIQFLLPCCIFYGAPAKVFYESASVLKFLAYQENIWEYDDLVQMLHDKVEKAVFAEFWCGKNDEEVKALKELFILLRAIKVSRSTLVWEYPYFENIKKNLKSNPSIL